MFVGIKAKQIAGVSFIVGAAVVALSLIHFTFVARVLLDESRSRAELLANTIFQRAKDVVAGQPDPWAAIRGDGGLHAILESGGFARNVTYAAICNTDGVAVAAWNIREDRVPPPAGSLDSVLALREDEQLRRIYSSGGQTLEVRQPLLLGGARFGTIRIGVSTALVREELSRELWLVGVTGFIALLVAVVVSAAFARLILRPIHVIKSGLTRLGRGEVGVRLDLPQQDEFGELGSFFNVVSAQMSAGRPQAADQPPAAGEHEGIEDDLAIFGPAGNLLFANPSMLAALAPGAVGRRVDELWADGDVCRSLVEQALGSGETAGPVTIAAPGGAPGGGREVTAHLIKGDGEALTAVLLVARDPAAIGRVHSLVDYSRRLVALGRLSSGVGHEVKNAANTITIYLALLEEKLRLAADAAGGGPALESALENVRVIGDEVKRLDKVMQGFLKFNRPEELKLQPVSVSSLVDDVVRTIGPECDAAGVKIVADELGGLPDINGDAEMLKQALLNLALNARQAMPHGGTLRISAAAQRGRRLEIAVEDSGVGIKPADLGKIFNLYFTTREGGSGLGLSMVYRAVQLHGGEIEVQSSEGRGTTFRILLPQGS